MTSDFFTDAMRESNDHKFEEIVDPITITCIPNEELKESEIDETLVEKEFSVTTPFLSRDTVQPRSRVFLRKSFLGQTTGWGRNQCGSEGLYVLEFERSTDRDEGFLEVKDAKANEQHKSIISALKVAAPEREFEKIACVVGNRGLVVESDFYTKLKKLDLQEGKKDKLFADHVTQVCEAHNRVIVSFLQQVQGGTWPTTEGARENIVHA